MSTAFGRVVFRIGPQSCSCPFRCCPPQALNSQRDIIRLCSVESLELILGFQVRVARAFCYTGLGGTTFSVFYSWLSASLPNTRLCQWVKTIIITGSFILQQRFSPKRLFSFHKIFPALSGIYLFCRQTCRNFILTGILPQSELKRSYCGLVLKLKLN